MLKMTLLENSVLATDIYEGVNSVANCDGFCEGYSFDVISDGFCEGFSRRKITVIVTIRNVTLRSFVTKSQ